MRNLINLVLILLLSISAENLLGGRLNAQENEDQNAAPQQQAPSSSQGQRSSSAAVQSVTGCVVQGEHGYALKTESDTYPLETDKDLSQYVNKKVKITGILEHHQTATPSATSGNGSATVSDIRLRVIASVIGDCNQQSK